MDPRHELVAYLHRQLVGPAGGEHEMLEAPPDRQYLMGTLYPQEADLQRQLHLAAEDPEGAGTERAAEDTAPASDPIPESNAWLPSSLGFSFYTDATTVEVRCAGARYVTHSATGDRGRRWERVVLPTEDHTLGPDRDHIDVLDGRAELRFRRRHFGVGQLVTVALVNAARHEPNLGKTAQWDRMLFQVRLEARPLDGEVLQYPSVRLASRDPEEQELRLQYRHVRTHAVGHGCAVEERYDGSGSQVTGLKAAVMPEAEVSGVRAAGLSGSPVLNLRYLADPEVSLEQLREDLGEFAADYRAWYVGQLTADIPAWGRDAADRVLGRIGAAVARIESGVRTLCDPSRPELLHAFRTANRAMALQMRHSARDQAGERRSRRDAVLLDPEPDPQATWRPFQLAFFLLALDGVADPRHPDRSTTDLIWFPTGGGKTEAYLLLAAFAMVLRRGDPVGRGTAVLSRYTLSLLTTQQFQRAATTVCALETFRRDAPDTYGEEPFSIGLWVGEATSPNTYEKARAAFDDVRAATRPDDVFILDRCPWCGTRILPAHKSPDIGDYGVRASADSFAFFCPRDECAFHDELPVAVVDEHLYDRPPTFVLGTVDKFARLAWEPRAGRLFGAGSPNLPPSLVIQDELHLLTGPLGTTVGLYESAVLGLCITPDGIGPKVVASTATIRRSGEQIQALYGGAAQLFPPAGLDARHSYFAEPDTSRPGRRYLGVMAQGHTAGRAAVATAATMLQGAWELPEEHRDAYWTLVAYHHSLRELGRTVTAAADDIPAQIAGLDSGAGTRRLLDHQVQELTSNLPRAEQPVLLDRLEKPWNDPQSVSFLPCTNMLSVGVDVKRLALMLMLGQPKTTSEYIQATSRVGRHAVAGLVVTFFNATRPRDRSHYETFDVYHRSLYRHVEPTSVTPWSVPSRRRALHAALVILVRHRLGMAAENQADQVIDRLPEVETVVAELAARADAREPGVGDDVRKELSSLLADWEDAARQARKEGRELYYRSQGKGQSNLIKSFEQNYGLWETPNSMRNVDRDCQVTVKGADL
ncbi:MULTISPECIES: helicase-related protein [Streptomyces]|uniref:Putative helicase family protein n=1 Tax=Streptomyces scabiei (strain 87.22) TaxID=680198 RepID=C9ZD18_STRSW|nr:helicase-related protein [Streptomyces scabiei]MBP5927530.1 helicase [Streptomyces sp. LBUM 1479]KFG10820.1 helicase [Streptomyces scabiei]MDX2532533.1 helicase-related protein [Streptomyces scabiei]MDX2579435.1 helicase-related protein [Streptomyces scabiei]MDX2658229.1 helicase-related protein [Streptomyces scabiei]